MTKMIKTLAEKFKEARAIQEQLYAEFVEEVGRLKVGPSAKGGMYINAQPNSNISNIDKEEAEFLIRKLKEFFGLD